ncbi:hypothetical protein ACH5RR_021015 [Cinchona calisaya]|uniref:Uncharacterized protein n=1 Tax=Cinchona calisaya TaxID=153742 RepID=A0ABD2ZHW3_9GENT
MAKRSWFFDNQFMILQHWEQGLEDSFPSFSTTLYYVQLWQLLVDWFTIATEKKIEDIFGIVHDITLPDGRGREAQHMKLLVSIDLHKPLLRGLMVKFDTVSSLVGEIKDGSKTLLALLSKILLPNPSGLSSALEVQTANRERLLDVVVDQCLGQPDGRALLSLTETQSVE